MKKDIYFKLNYNMNLKDLFNTNKQMEKFETEIVCLKKHKYNILELNYDNYEVILKCQLEIDEKDIYYKKIDLVPYVNLRPCQEIIEKDGNNWKRTGLIIS